MTKRHRIATPLRRAGAHRAMRWNRRAFLATAWGAGITACLARAGRPQDVMPPVTNPRATDGDDVYGPDWAERLTLTVGPDRGDLCGRDDRVLQAAVDYVARLGGGTVQLLPGTFTLRNAVFLPSRVRLRGSGSDTVITKIPSEKIPLVADSDWYDQEITLESAGDFRVGDGVLLRATNPHTGGPTVIKRTLVARCGNRFRLNDGLRENLWLSGQPTCASLFPLLTSEHTADVQIERLTLDGHAQRNDNLDGNYGGCIFLQDCNRYVIHEVEARNYNGDGISFQICHDVTVRNCYSHDHAGLGLHPGSGSQRPVLLDNRLERNTIGLFWCWGVKFGLAARNRIEGNRQYGISIGHNDTDNVMRENEITNSGQAGVLFRDESGGRDFWPSRNALERNRICNSGAEDGVAIDLQGQPRDIRLIENELCETRAAARRIGIRIAAQVGAVELRDNRITGFAEQVHDARPA
jgi:hypothetical protein